MPSFPGFVGPSNVYRTPDLSVERTVNFMIQQVAQGTGKTPSGLIYTPCVTPFARMPGTKVRCLYAENGRAFAVSDTHHGEILDASGGLGWVTHLDAIASNDDPASYCSNGSAGNQNLVISGGLGYVYDLLANTLTQITSTDFPTDILMCAFLDQYGLILRKNSRQFRISALDDFTDWDPLDVGERSEASDNINAMVRNHKEIWFPCTQTTEIWVDIGDPLFPFAPLPGTFMDQGSLASFAVVRLDNTLFWIGQDEHGDGIVYRANGYAPQRVSTDAVEFALAQSTDLGATIGWSYQEEGHLYYVLYIPDLLTHWVYDVNGQLWHERALSNGYDADGNTIFLPDVGRCHCFAFGKHLIGDRTTGTIYQQSLSQLGDFLNA